MEQLVVTRSLELNALLDKYEADELTEKQLELLKKVSDDLKAASEGLLDRIVDMEKEEVEELELTEEQISKIETALAGLGESLDRVSALKDEEDEDEDEDKDEDEDFDKYDRRIAHLEQIMAKTPANADKGLSRAIENARRQQAKRQAKNGIVPEPEVEGDGDENGTDVVDDGEENGTQIEGGEEENGTEVEGEAGITGSDEKVKNNNNGNNKVDKDNGKSNGAKDNGKAPGNSGNAPGNSGNAPGNSGKSPGNGNNGKAPGNSGNAPGRN